MYCYSKLEEKVLYPVTVPREIGQIQRVHSELGAELGPDTPGTLPDSFHGSARGPGNLGYLESVF